MVAEGLNMLREIAGIGKAGDASVMATLSGGSALWGRMDQRYRKLIFVAH